MHHDIFDSYEKARDEATAFKIIVALTDGGVVESSAIPIPALDAVLADMATVEQTGAWFHVWNRITNTVTSVLPFQIKTIQISLIGRC